MPSNRPQGAPVLVEETPGCSYIFEWHTIYACGTQTQFPPNMTRCDAMSPSFQQYDLSPLIQAVGSGTNWKALAPTSNGSPSYLFSINICAGLVPANETIGACAGNTSVCQYQTIGNIMNPAFPPKNIGLSSSPFISSSGSLTINFTMVNLYITQRTTMTNSNIGHALLRRNPSLRADCLHLLESC